jgi:hypothetical protein
VSSNERVDHQVPIDSPIDMDDLVFAAPGETDGWDFDAIPPLGTPVITRHQIDLPLDTELELRAEADRLGITMEELIVSRLHDAA